MPTVTIIVLDSVGVGALPDAGSFGDAGAHTLDHTVREAGITLPNLSAFGLGNIEGVDSLGRTEAPAAAWGRLTEVSAGKDTTTGHWEFMGIQLETPFRTFREFPPAVMDAFSAATGRSYLGNYAASGTDIIRDLGAEHLATGKPIVYTSADSVFQIAAHTDVVPLEELYRWCEAARRILTGEFAVARVIARPFHGQPGTFERLGADRRDYSVIPPRPTVLDRVKEAGLEVAGLGKIPDIYGHRGFTREIATKNNMDGVDKVLGVMQERPAGLVFLNLVEFDSLYGHRRDVAGYARALQEFDARLPELTRATDPDGALLLVSDHGNDPTWSGTDHTREYGLLLCYRPGRPGRDLGTRSTFADVGATAAELLDVTWDGPGTSFA